MCNSPTSACVAAPSAFSFPTPAPCRGPADLTELFHPGSARRAEFVARLPTAVQEVVRHQADIGIDIVNDGELSKLNFSHYARERLGGLEHAGGTTPQGSARNIVARDAREFPNSSPAAAAGCAAPAPLAARQQRQSNRGRAPARSRYIGAEQPHSDVANLKAALKGLDVEGFLPAIAPGTIEHWLYNEHYADDEEFLFAIADAHARGVQGHHRRRPEPADRRSGPARTAGRCSPT